MADKMRLLTQAEVAERLRVSVRTVARLRADGELPYLPGRPVRIAESDLGDYLERRKRWLRTRPIASRRTFASRGTEAATGSCAGQSETATAGPERERIRAALRIARLRSR